VIDAAADAPLVPDWSSGLDEAAHRIAGVVASTEQPPGSALATIATGTATRAVMAARDEVALPARLATYTGRALGDALQLALVVAWAIALVWATVATLRVPRRAGARGRARGRARASLLPQPR
jgi:hypothetical protein